VETAYALIENIECEKKNRGGEIEFFFDLVYLTMHEVFFVKLTPQKIFDEPQDASPLFR